MKEGYLLTFATSSRVNCLSSFVAMAYGFRQRNVGKVGEGGQGSILHELGDVKAFYDAATGEITCVTGVA